MKRTLGGMLVLCLLLSLLGCTGPAELPTQEAATVPQTTAAPIPEETTQPAALSDDSTFAIQFIDVGQADAALIQCDGHYMLIDGGNRADSNKIYSVLQKNGVQKLDIVVGTHAHEDHIGGIPGAFHYTTSDLTLCPVTEYDSKVFRDFKRYAEEKGGGITVPRAGDTYGLGSATVTILGLNNGSSTNDTSIVLRIDYGETSFLFTGDAEVGAEKVLTGSNSNLQATVLKVGHHGSDTSTGYVFLRSVMPRYGVISCGKDNSYGHPDEAVLSRLRDADTRVFRTDQQGDIFCTSDGKEVFFQVSRNPYADTLAPAEHRGTEPNSEETSPVKPETAPAETAPQSTGNDYVLNNNSMKFHRPTCSSGKKISPENREEVNCSRDALIAKGYEPCKRCEP